MHSYLIGYVAIDTTTDKACQSEVEFDIEVDNKEFEDAFFELWNLINIYCKESNLEHFKIMYVHEVPYEEYG